MSRIKCNVGKTERIVRVILGLAALALGLYARSWWGLLGLLPLVTAVIGWCPVSSLFGISTCADPNSTLKDTSIYEEEHPMRLHEVDTKDSDLK